MRVFIENSGCFIDDTLSDAYMRYKTLPTLVEIMACRLFGAEPLSEQKLLDY